MLMDADRLIYGFCLLVSTIGSGGVEPTGVLVSESLNIRKNTIDIKSCFLVDLHRTI